MEEANVFVSPSVPKNIVDIDTPEVQEVPASDEISMEPDRSLIVPFFCWSRIIRTVA